MYKTAGYRLKKHKKSLILSLTKGGEVIEGPAINE
jgi:hypothetical protein